ncbi:hypothetical protein LguiB_005650 [Lonicera macranthoides]
MLYPSASYLKVQYIEACGDNAYNKFLNFLLKWDCTLVVSAFGHFVLFQANFK